MAPRKPPLPALLSSRYNGPIPPRAVLAADHDAPLPDQYRHRRLLAWIEVRSLGRALVFESRAFRETANIAHYREWQRLRKHLVFALRSWRTYREWETTATRQYASPSDPAGDQPSDVEPPDPTRAETELLTDQ